MAYVLGQINKACQYYLLEYSGNLEISRIHSLNRPFVNFVDQFFRSTIRALTIDKFTMADHWRGWCVLVFCAVAGTALDGKAISISN